MAQLISILGSTGVGKTSLARALAAARPFAIGLEQHDTRPYQARFKQDPRFALANQVDYLLLRAEQETDLRRQTLPALLDGGLEQDYYGFTKLFWQRGLLSDDDHEILGRLYRQLRTAHPPPELFIYLYAPAEVIRSRLAKRERINIASDADVEALEGWLTRWLDTVEAGRVLRLDVSAVSGNYAEIVPVVLNALQQSGIHHD